MGRCGCAEQAPPSCRVWVAGIQQLCVADGTGRALPWEASQEGSRLSRSALGLFSFWLPRSCAGGRRMLSQAAVLSGRCDLGVPSWQEAAVSRSWHLLSVFSL